MTASNEVASSSSSAAPAATSTHSSQPIPGHRLVLGFFVILAICVAVMFVLFAISVRPEDRDWLPKMLFRYLYMPVVATGIMVAIDAYRHQRKGWWVYLLMAPVPLVNIVLNALWLMKWRHGEPVGPVRM